MSVDLSALMTMDRTALAERWEQVFGHPAPASPDISRRRVNRGRRNRGVPR
jgi:hypothetical protein